MAEQDQVVIPSDPPASFMKRGKSFSIIAVLLSVALSLVAGEFYVRLAGKTVGLDGNFIFGHRRLKPFRLPIKTVEASLHEYLRRSDSYIMYDPEMGWTIRPSCKSKDGMYVSNSLGLRSSPRDVSANKPPGKLRVCLFGDSFTHANDVAFEDSWGYLLEKKLTEKGIPAEVLNFGVPGYGIDQAYLRWKKEGARFSPDVVILAFVMDDVARLLNIFWPVRSPDAGFFFSKPRFYFSENELKMLNHPAMPPGEIPDVLRNLDHSMFGEYEYYYRKSDYRDKLRYRSRLYSLVENLLTVELFGRKLYIDKKDPNKKYDFFDPDGEPGRLAREIIADFQKDVGSSGARFIIVHLPNRSPMRRLLSGKEMMHSALLAKLDESFDSVHLEGEMIRAARKYSLDSLFNGHYSPKGNEIVSEVLAAYIIDIYEKRNRSSH